MNQLIENENTNLTNFNSVQQEIEKSRAVQEVQGAIFMARKFPRNEQLVAEKLKFVAKNIRFAEQALYAYPRGGTMITGPSIRAAETLARYWGNTSFGTKELSQNTLEHSSEALTYCWDLETNVRSERIFKSNHIRETKNGNSILTSSRDIYEKVANDGSRRLRSCILAIIPNYIVEEFVSNCENALVGSSGKTLEERTKELLEKFESIGIDKSVIEAKMGVKTNKFVARNIVTLGYIYNSIKDNIAPASHFFTIPTEIEKQINSALKKGKETINVEVSSNKLNEEQQALFIDSNGVNEDYEP